MDEKQKNPQTQSMSIVHPDIIDTHILPRLDAAAIASVSCASSELYSLITSNQALWENLCTSTWPSTNTPLLRHVISSFLKGGPRSFFCDSVTNPDSFTAGAPAAASPSELISAVDVHYRGRHLLSKVVETEAFDGSPFRVDLFDPKDSVPTGIPHPLTDELYGQLLDGLTLSWILIDPSGRRAMNLSSHKPVISERLWLPTGEVHLSYVWVFSGAAEEGSPLERVKCEISVTSEMSQCGEMYVNQVSLHMEDVYGDRLSGKESLSVLLKGMESKRGCYIKGEKEEEARRRHDAYLQVRRQKLESIKRERRLLTRCQMILKLLIFVCIWLFVFSVLNIMKARSFF